MKIFRDDFFLLLNQYRILCNMNIIEECCEFSTKKLIQIKKLKNFNVTEVL